MEFKILGIEHIGIAQDKDSDKLSSFFEDILNMSKKTEIVKGEKVLTEIFDTGAGKIELLSAIDKDSTISKYLAKKGKSIHHVAILVDNLEAALDYLKLKNVKLINETPQKGADNMKIAFIHPHSTPGILLEFCQED
jgi:methylmalonyl-CoA/ethylmalonyl-CoA epimerase